MVLRVTFRPNHFRFSDRDQILMGLIEYGTDLDVGGDGFDGAHRQHALIVTGPANLQSHVYTRGLADPEPARLELLRRLLFRRFSAELTAWLHDPAGSPELSAEGLLTVDELAVGAAAAEVKRCTFQRATPAGLVCDVTLEGASTETSVPLCNRCRLPGDGERCTALVHPKVDWPGDGNERQPRRARCDAGQDDRVGDTSACRFGGHDCWRMDMAVKPPSSAEPSADAPQLVVDEFGHLRLVLEKQVGRKLDRGAAELQLGAGIVGSCANREDLASRIQAVASLVAGLHIGKTALDAARIELPPDSGSLVALQAFAAHLGAEGCEEPIGRLRALVSIRNLAPAHSAFDERVFLLTQFGVAVPIEDFGSAWLRIADGVRRALRDLRLAFQAVGEGDD